MKTLNYIIELTTLLKFKMIKVNHRLSEMGDNYENNPKQT